MATMASRTRRTVPPLVAWNNPKSPPAEAYRALRTNLQFIGLDRPLSSLLVTSAGPGEGKSTTSANLGAVMAQAGRRVILVGADMRKPQLHNIFGFPNDVGLTNVLTGHVPWQKALRDTPIDGVRLLASGPIPPNPAELLGSQRMGDLLKQLQEEVDMVIVDAPPVLSVTDAGVLSQWVDGVLFVVCAGVTPRELALEAKLQLEKVGARIVGTVVNRIERQAGYYHYYYYYYGDDNPAPANGEPWWRRLFNARRNGGR